MEDGVRDLGQETRRAVARAVARVKRQLRQRAQAIASLLRVSLTTVTRFSSLSLPHSRISTLSVQC